jgi:excisionase family DNA binding protein
MEPLLFRVSEAASALGISRAKAYELLAAGKLPSVKLDGSLRVPVAALKQWIARELETRAADRV